MPKSPASNAFPSARPQPALQHDVPASLVVFLVALPFQPEQHPLQEIAEDHTEGGHQIDPEIALAVALTGWRVMRARVAAGPADDEWHVVIDGAACTFLALPRPARVLASTPAGANATVDVSAHYLDHAAHQVISDWRRQHEADGGTVHVRGRLETGHAARKTAGEVVEAEKARSRIVIGLSNRTRRDRRCYWAPGR